MNTLLIILGVVVAAFFMLYVTIIMRRNSYKEALSNVDVQLRKRYDLIPNILAIAKRFMQQETSIMNDITTLRTQAGKTFNQNVPVEVQEHFSNAEKLSSKLGQFMVTMEAYPDLKSNQTMIEAMQSLNEVEAQIAAARRFYNSSVTRLNNIVQIFPGNIIAKLIGAESMPFYQSADKIDDNIDAKKYLG
jgi:LemA protein